MRVQLTREQVHLLARSAQRDANRQRQLSESSTRLRDSERAMMRVDADEIEKAARALDHALETVEAKRDA